MATNFYYIYALKDPTINPAKAFYIGKGTGSRAFDHLIRKDNTKKYKKILDILKCGEKPIIEILADDLTEIQAIKLEAELISAFGIIGFGGMLTNAIMPTGYSSKKETINIPTGCVEKSQLGLVFLKNSIVNLIEANPEGLTNAEIAAVLGLRSDYESKQKDYLSFSILGLLIREKKIKYHIISNKKRYFVNT